MHVANCLAANYRMLNSICVNKLCVHVHMCIAILAI